MGNIDISIHNFYVYTCMYVYMVHRHVSYQQKLQLIHQKTLQSTALNILQLSTDICTVGNHADSVVGIPRHVAGSNSTSRVLQVQFNLNDCMHQGCYSSCKTFDDWFDFDFDWFDWFDESWPPFHCLTLGCCTCVSGTGPLLHRFVSRLTTPASCSTHH